MVRPNSPRRVLGIITARGGSKGLPGKNLLKVNGRPLISWTINAALDSLVLDRVILSSDDEKIIECAIEWGCDVPFRRPSELSDDFASSVDVVLHALELIPGYDFFVLLQPTSPLRTAEDIDAAFSLLESSNASSCVSICEVDQSPYWMYEIAKDGALQSVLPQEADIKRRQDLPLTYILNGAIYIAKVSWFLEFKNFIGNGSVGYLMSKKNSLDIDTRADFDRFCQILKDDV